MKRHRFSLVIISCTATLCVIHLLPCKLVNLELYRSKQSDGIKSRGDESLPLTPRPSPTEQPSNTQSTPHIGIKSTANEEYPSLEECYSIIDNGRLELNLSVTPLPDHTDDDQVVDILKQGCIAFKRRYRFVSRKQEETISSAEESLFSIAYTLLVHKNLHQVATLLSAIYRSQHIFCVHVDAKSPTAFPKGISMMTDCFPNFFQTSKSESVVYASFSRLKAEVRCMKDLLNVPKNMYDWKYLINLCGQDFPTSTNLEIVEQLKAMNGKMCLSGTTELNDIAIRRVKFVHIIRNTTVGNKTTETVYQTDKLLDPPPYNLTIAKSIAYAVFTREFLQWSLIDSEEGRALYNWSTYTRTPDEHFWATLHIYPKSPGWSKTLNWRGLARAILWRGTNDERHCKGYWQHNSCVFGGQGMWWLTQVSQPFVNKFDIACDSIPITCLRKLIDQRTAGNATDKNPRKNPLEVS